MTTYVQGLRETVRDLEKVGVEVSDMKDVFTDIGNVVASDARTLVPKKTGRLGMAIKPTKTKNKAAVRAGSARVPYAGVQNYGWPSRNIRGRLFLQSAIDSNQSRAIQMMEDGLSEIINKHF